MEFIVLKLCGKVFYITLNLHYVGLLTIRYRRLLRYKYYIGEIKKEGRSPISRIGSLIVNEGKSRYVDSNLWMSMSDEVLVPNELLESSSPDEEDVGSPLQPGSYAADGDDLIFGFFPSSEILHTFHPQPASINRLWDSFRENVDPLVKVFHTPTVHQLILDASEHLEHLPKGTEALMFAIYSCAVTSLSDAECEAMNGEPKRVLSARYQYATKRALISAGLLKSSEILSVRQLYDPRSMWIMIGLHRDGAYLQLPFFEVEMRRRLWWQTILLDGRLAELSGSEISVLADSWDTNLPSNVNDDDLSPEMKEEPIERAGSTEMIFCLLRYQIGEFLRLASPTNFFNRTDTGLSIAGKDRVIDELEKLIEHKFLIHWSAIRTMRLWTHHPRHYPDKSAVMPQHEKDELFSYSMRNIEYDNLIHLSARTQRFLWHVNVDFQWDALIYVLTELCHRTSGALADKAWKLIDEMFEYHSEILTETKKALHIAIGNLTRKAWEARKSALVRAPHCQNSSRRELPRFISLLYSQRDITESAQPSIMHVPSPSADVISGIDSPTLSGVGLMDPSPVDWAKWNDLLQEFGLQEECYKWQ
ncbi:hypothetical protein V1517DRAFT_354508 [Lipomyces orientalis]|uniref:Uncharacterized protein n=1 Tax=Lipomyces orientalis TaxID=1233043 RepID=A0ACC3TIA7_9ASCO